MNNKTIKQIIATFMMVACLFTNTVVTTKAATTVYDVATSNETSASNSEDGILKVNIDDKGELTYQEPVSIATTDEVVPDENKVFSWNNATVYFLLTDRFSNGDTTNDHSYGRGMQADGKTPQVGATTSNPGTFHGGDLKGLTAKVNEGYFNNLGVNAIWITAPYEQIHGYTSGHVLGDNGQAGTGGGFPYFAYHGYWTLDYSNIDANMGTEKDFETFVDTAHSKGIRVVMDIVLNHVGYATMKDLSEYGMGSALKTGWETYYYGDAKDRSGGDPEANWYNLSDPSWSKWWGPSFVRVLLAYSGYNAVGKSAGLTSTLCGLPDIYTESVTEIAIPPLLVTKWTKEGRLTKESAELDSFFASSKLAKTPRNYVIKWLTDWVREYGVDGFRCDTAAHVEKAGWGALKAESVKALKEWRTNNPTKPGAKWTDDFWMTGEAWGHGVSKDDYYTTGGFDSMINFGFKGVSVASAKSVYGGLSAVNAPNSGFNALSYLSSHDDGLYGRTNLIDGGTCLLLAPGGVQIFYGDESCRPFQWKDMFTGNDYKDQPLRSDMNWSDLSTAGSVAAKNLEHWQKVGQFRNNHLSVGAGQNIDLATSPYTFGRTYAKNGVTDRVVCAMGATAGATTDIAVAGVFSDGAKVRDFYTGEMYTVATGKVSVKVGANGVVLLEKGDKSPDVGVSPISQTYYTDSLELELSVSNDADAKYSINDGAEVSFKNGDKITIGEGEDFGTSTKITVSASNADGTAGPSSYTYLKDDPTNKMVKVHFKKTGWTAPNIYVYTGDGDTAKKLAGAWPGTPMKDDGNGWYSFTYIGESTAKVIFNAAGKGQDPTGTAPGYDVTGEMNYEEGKWSSVAVSTATPTVKALSISSLKSSLVSPQLKGKSIEFTTAVVNATGTALYEYSVDGKIVCASSKEATYTWTPTAKGTYTVSVSVQDDNKKPVTKSITYTITDVVAPDTGTPDTGTKTPDAGTKTPDSGTAKDPLTEASITSDFTTVKLGSKVKLTAKATGGQGTLKYQFNTVNQGQWVKLGSLSEDAIYNWTPTKAGTYSFYVSVIDLSNDAIKNSGSITITVTASDSVAPGTDEPIMPKIEDPVDTLDSFSILKVIIIMTFAAGIMLVGAKNREIK